MKILTLDFETFYSREYSLKKMSPAEYILDPQFECTGLAVKRGKDAPLWVHGDEVQDFFNSEPTDVLCLSHNALFDMCICAWRYGWVPKLMVDTLGIARAVLQHKLKYLSLDKVGEHLGIGRKTGVLATVLGMRMAEIRANPALYASFIDYGLNDADICYGIFEKLVLTGEFPMEEVFVMDMVLRCAVQPQFIADIDMLRQSLSTIQKEKDEILATAMMVGASGKADLMSNDKFADLLRAHGVVPPTKISGTTGRTTYAFAKSDQDFLDLQDHPSTGVQALVAARLGHKSTIEETRHERFINIASLDWPVTTGPSPVTTGGYRRLMPMPLKYSGAHTHRLSGDWKLNVQNMGRGSTLRKSLTAPEGYVVVAGDESQVEARFVCTLAGQEDMRMQFEHDEDVYSIFASGLFGFEVTKANKLERFIGKQCLAGDTLVLTNEGWVPILYLKNEHKLWDGIEWVSHEGLLSQGVKPTQTAHGLTITEDHEILTELGWQEWREVHTNKSLFQSALSLVNLPSQGGSVGLPSVVNQLDGNQYAPAHVGRSQSQTGVTLPMEGLQGATIAPSRHLVESGTGHIKKQCPTTNTGLGYSTDYLQPSADVTTQRTQTSTTMEGGASQFSMGGGKTENHSSHMSKLCRDGINQNSKWTEKMSMGGMNPETSGSSQDQATSQTSDRSEKCKSGLKSLKPVYDIANAGPRRRFTVLSSEGPVIVHNCILGLGYGLGKDKFSYSLPVLAWNQMKLKLDYSLEDGTKAVNFYRTKNYKIKAAWDLLNTLGIRALTGGGDWQFGPVLFRKGEIVLPNGMKLYYHNLRQVEGGRFGFEWVFEYGGITKRCYGGMLFENVVQALARIVVMQAALRIQQHLHKLGIRLALQVHDELVFVVKKEHEQVVRYVLQHELRKRPEWLPNVPLNCEIESGPTYGDAK